MSKKEENKIIINCGGDICLDNKTKPIFYEDKLTFFDKLAEHISDLLGIDFCIPYSSYYKISNKLKINNSNYIFLEGDPKKSFDNLKSYLDDADVNCFNMEFPLTDEFFYYGSIGCPTSYAQILKNNKINYVNIANNHIFDQGAKGFRDTINCLKGNGISFFGGGENKLQSHKPAIFEKNGIKIGFLGYFQNTRTNINYVCSAEDKPGINPICEEEIIEDIKKSKNEYGCNFVFVSLHGDIENHRRISKGFKRICKKIIDVGGDGVFGHHSHVPKEYEIYKGKPIFYSFGNFVFGQYYKKFWKDNFFAQIKIIDNKMTDIEIFEITGKKESLFNPKLIKKEKI